MTRPLAEIFAELQAITGQSRLSVKVDCGNLETVYIDVDATGRFVVSDRYYTFSYLSDPSVSGHLTIAQLGQASIEEICAQHGVSLIDLLPDSEENALWMAIGTYAQTNAEVRQAVNAVAACVDAMFEHALIRH